MRKKLEAELISIAHRILQLKNKDDVRELHHETQKLYEKLSVLLFVEENFSEVKPTIGIHEIEKKLEKAFDFDEKIVVAQLEEEAQVINIESKQEETAPVEAISEEKEELVKETVVEEKVAEIKTPIIEDVVEEQKAGKKQISFDEILGGFQPDPIFERVSDIKKTEEPKSAVETSKIIDKKIEDKVTPDVSLETAFIDIKESKDLLSGMADTKPAANLNDKLNKGINIGLNDRIAFEKNLFGGSSEDFNRVVSQLSTFDSLEDAKNFIEEMVKPDYNNWNGQDEFAARFMEFVENKFV